MIDETAYRERAKRIEDEIALATVGVIDTSMDERELQGILDFAEYVIAHPSRVG